jgi:hypothetical protein
MAKGRFPREAAFCVGCLAVEGNLILFPASMLRYGGNTMPNTGSYGVSTLRTEHVPMPG